ncbi:MAG: 50S ribosomal protein L35 [Propionibacterium sp.]|nr:50S ribosomal protein L35 [Propionibacterium sp.]
MPKMKTHSGMKKRVTRTGSGKLAHKQAGTTHLNEHKPSKRMRRLQGVEILTGGDARKVRKLLGKYKGK